MSTHTAVVHVIASVPADMPSKVASERLISAIESGLSSIQSSGIYLEAQSIAITPEPFSFEVAKLRDPK